VTIIDPIEEKVRPGDEFSLTIVNLAGVTVRPRPQRKEEEL
jgi:hypothetical protein